MLPSQLMVREFFMESRVSLVSQMMLDLQFVLWFSGLNLKSILLCIAKVKCFQVNTFTVIENAPFYLKCKTACRRRLSPVSKLLRFSLGPIIISLLHTRGSRVRQKSLFSLPTDYKRSLIPYLCLLNSSWISHLI